MTRRRLYDLGFGYRAGDKGDISNIALFAPDVELYELARAQVSVPRVQMHFGGLVRGRVDRYEAANVLALNFVLHDALGGGAPRSLRADNLGKTLGGALVRLDLDVPDELAARPAPRPDVDWALEVLRRRQPDLTTPTRPARGVLDDATLTAFVASTALDTARAFYEGVLGLRHVAGDAYGAEYRSGPTRLRVALVDAHLAPPGTVVGWTVADIHAAVAALEENVRFERFPGMDQDAHGVWRAPSGHQVAWFRDPDGNLLSLTEVG